MERQDGTRIDLTSRPDLGRSEWLLTNALGGFAMGCADAVPRRRYHALLIGATTPPVGRVVALAHVADSIVVAAGDRPERIDLSDFDFPGRPAARSPDEFIADPARVSWRWITPAGSVRRSLELADARNAGILTYERDGERPARLELRPLVALRDFHELAHEHAGAPSLTLEGPDACVLRAGSRELRLRCVVARFEPAPDWWRAFQYAFDRERGQDFAEDLFCPGTFVVDPWPAGAVPRLEAWTDGQTPPPPEPASPKRARLRVLRERVGPRLSDAHRSAGAALADASDHFIVRRDLPSGGSMATIIAGYPWFSDWGRDSMIALRGLLLATGRVPEAVGVLRAFAGQRRRGLIPNCFIDSSGHAEYNTADAALWFVHAALDAAEAGADPGIVAAELLPACVDILRAYAAGTDYDIRADADALIRAGTPGTQLTWMDAARDGVVFTPRSGKPVELNALWIAALRRMASADAARRAEWGALADRAASSFSKFWNLERRCLFDCLPDGDTPPSDEIRPNQIYAVSLPHSPLSREQQRAVVECVRNQLLTPMGLRTLERDDFRYRPRYEGTLFERDGAYHNGTAWPFLLGPYAEAVLRVGDFSPQARRDAFDAIAPLLGLLTGTPQSPTPIGAVAEIYDAERPQRPQGCPAQAWSVGELLRVLLLIDEPAPTARPRQ
ncbi:MAG: amylo-alpha-1,6-glucosidase [Planctomycetota bacterium]|nr:amylo-alpha-1,6-glucosidase [Planctomycetota bacterium]